MEKNIKIGILFSLTGTTQVTEVGQYQSVLLAIKQINKSGGINDKQLVPVVKDIASDPFIAAREAENLIVNEKVVAIIGLYTSASRKKVLNIVEKYESLLIYPTQYEGEEQHPNIYYTGPLPTQNLLHYIPWIIKNLGQKIYLIGSDYIYPREMNYQITHLTESENGYILGTDHYTLGSKDFDKTFSNIHKLNPDVIFSTLVGDSAISFYKQYYKQGITQPITSSITAETEIAAINPKYTVGHYSCFPYFSSVQSEENNKFKIEFEKHFGSTVISSAMENAYNSVYLLCNAIKKANSLKIKSIKKNLSGAKFLAPQGPIFIDDNNHHTWLHSRIGKVNEKGAFDIIWESPQAIQPIPFSKYVFTKNTAEDQSINKMGREIQSKIQHHETLIYELKKASEHLNATTAFFDNEGMILNLTKNNEDSDDVIFSSFAVGAKVWQHKHLKHTAPALALNKLQTTIVENVLHTELLNKWNSVGIPIFDSNKSLLGILGLFINNKLYQKESLNKLIKCLEKTCEYAVRNIEKSHNYIFTYDLLTNLVEQNDCALIIIENKKTVFQNKVGKSLCNTYPKLISNLIKNIETDSNNFYHKKINNTLIEIHIKEVNKYHFVYLKILNPDSSNREITPKKQITTLDLIGSDENFLKSVSLTKAASKTDANVLILGESGTGKELFARAIHNESTRRNKPFIALNCAALPANLINAELFGYVEGAFTGAKKQGSPGKFELANGGTIFLDEIGDMPLELQATLLRVLQEKEITRVGGHTPIPIDVRIVAATNKNLNQEIAYKGDFRSDLYFRLNVFTIELLPLRERKNDITELVFFFLKELSNNTKTPPKEISDEALSRLINYHWPGNIRELRNVVERAFYISQTDNKISIEHLASYLLSINDEGNFPIKTKSSPTSVTIEGIKNNGHKSEEQEIINALLKFKGNITKTAKHLGMSRTTLYKKIDKHNLKNESI